MTAQRFSRVAAVIFAIIALLQLARAISGFEIAVGGCQVEAQAASEARSAARAMRRRSAMNLLYSRRRAAASGMRSR